MGFAAGKHAKFISDRSGMAFPYNERVREWNGAIVHTSEFEEKHPQLTPATNLSDDVSLKDARPDRDEPSVSVLLSHNPFKTGTGGSNPTTVTVTERAHGRSASDTVRFRNVAPFDGISSSTMQGSSGYTIQSVVDTNSATATLGNTTGGGGIASAGPVTLES